MNQEQIQIPKGWELKTLSDVTELIQDVDHNMPPKTENGVPFVSTKDFTKESGINFSNAKNISLENYLKSIKKFSIKKEDILFSRIGTIGKAIKVKVDKKFTISYSLVLIRPNKKIIIPNFLLYYVQSPLILFQASRDTKSVGTPDLGIKKIRSFQIPLPTMKIQKSIIQKLDPILEQLKEKKITIFSLIEQNKEKIDFFEKNWISYVITNVFENHPQRKEWKFEKLANEEIFLDIISGGTPPRANSEYFGGNIPWVRLKDMKSKYISTSNETLTEKGLKKGSRKIPKNAIILSTRASIGKVAISQTEMCTNQGFKSIVCNNEKILPEFLYYFLLSMKSQLLKLCTSTTFAEVNLTKLKNNIIVPIPPILIQKKIIQNIKNAEEKFSLHQIQFENIKKNHEKRINHLLQINSSILNSAFSGKLVK